MRYSIVVIFAILFSISTFSQEEKSQEIYFENENLEVVLNNLEKIYSVKFSYPSELVASKKITLEKESRTLDETLFEISLTSDIQFNRLDSTYIYLTQSQVEEISEVFVKSYLTQGITKNKDATFQINPNKLGLLAGLTETDILESIQQLPGVTSIDETATSFSVRGGSSDQNRVIWDNINIYHTGHLFGMVSVFNPNIAQNITFYNKGTNAKFGDRVSSVIDISTTNKISNKTQLELGINGINADVFLETPIIKDKLSVQTSFRRSYEDIFETNTFKKFEQKAFQHTKIDGEFFYFKDYNLKLNYSLNKKNRLSLSLIHIDNDLENDFSDTTLNTTYMDILDSENDGYNLQWNKQWNENINQKTSINLSKYRFNYNFITHQNNIFISDFSKTNTITDFGFSTDVTINIQKNKSINFGYQNSLKEVNFLFKEVKDLLYILDEDNSNIDTHSIYSGYTYKNPKLFDFYGGLRVNYYTKLNTTRFEPRFVLNKELSENLKIQLTGEIKNQIISQIDETILSDLSLERKLWRLADGQNFPIINSFQISSGATYSKNNWTTDFDLYYKKTDGITALSLGFLNPTDNTFHKGKQKVVGFDFYLKKKLSNRMQTWVSYSFLDVKNKYNGLNSDTYFTANTEIKHAISASLDYKINDFQFALGWKWRSGKPLTDLDIDINGNAFYDGINTERLPYYHRLDFSSTYKFSFSKNGSTRGKVGFSVRNIYNNKNHISTEFSGNNTIDDPIKILEKHSIGITPNIMFRVYF